ncbi:fetuin-B-like [Pungitius pungitius]|uniref:fetuin-B-like n=1 Tax=Pungitius pungitius TaxID=134920 RepID=UPI00188907FA|nr:fetuin-B-like [Pungitius pungitius]
MKHCMLLPLLLALGCMYVRAAPMAHEGVEEGSCEDASAIGAAGLAITKINQDRVEGYVFGLHRLSNVHVKRHGQSGTVFYLTLDVVETNCSVLSKKDWKACEARPTHDTPVYGQCKAAIYISKVHRVVRLYKYDCVIRPVPAGRVPMCAGCASPLGLEHAEVQKAVTLSLDKFNRQSELPNRFSLLKVQRARGGVATGMYYIVEYTIQETNCTKSAAATDDCPHIEWESAHKGFCKASIYHSLTGEAGESDVHCDIYEPEAAEPKKKHHTLGGAIGHRDTHAHSHDHDGAHAHDHDHDHQGARADAHDHDHAKSHTHHSTTQKHAGDSGHHHTHDHEVGSGHGHAHNHSHEHGPGHDHVHFHHGKAHNHSHGPPHRYNRRLYTTRAHDHPIGAVRILPDMDQPMTLPSFPDTPVGGPAVGVTLPLKPDPQVPGQTEPTIRPFPKAISASCVPAPRGDSLVEKVFAEDPMFKPAA